MIVDRPKARGRHIEKLLTRHSSLAETPEGKLWIRMLSDAWEDARSVKATQNFFRDGRAQTVCDAIGFDGDIKELFEAHHQQGKTPAKTVQEHVAKVGKLRERKFRPLRLDLYANAHLRAGAMDYKTIRNPHMSA